VSTPLRFVFTALALWVATGLQMSLSHRWGVWGARPDFLLILVVAFAQQSSLRGALWIGFCAGVLQGAISGANLTHYVASRVVASAVAANLRKVGFGTGPVTAGAFSLVACLAAQLVLMFLAPQPEVLSFLVESLKSSVLNAVLAIPVCGLAARFVPDTKV
jgi:rod shape-determining protein MreD